MILCDIGNTTFDFLIKKRRVKYSVDTKWKKLPELKSKLYFVSVNQKATRKFLKKYPNAIDISNLFQFETFYQGMGVDRQVACNSIKNGIVVDVGSAITIDVMKNHKHLGGTIHLGINKLISFYPRVSPKLNFHFEKKINLDKMPTNTNEAISYAILKSIILLIKDIKKEYDLPIYFTGEDSSFLTKHFKKSKYKKDLIFKSMKKIIKRKNR